MTFISSKLMKYDAPFTHFIADEVLDRESLDGLAAQLDQVLTHTERVHSQPGGDKTYSMDFVSLLDQDVETNAVAELPPAWKQLYRSLSSTAFREELSQQTGIDVLNDSADIGVYLHRAGDSVSTHRDKQHKTLSCILYLNRQWTSEDGGDLLLFADDLAFPIEEIRPRGGRLVAFAPAKNSWHAVAPVTAARYMRQTVQVEFAPRMIGR